MSDKLHCCSKNRSHIHIFGNVHYYSKTPLIWIVLTIFEIAFHVDDEIRKGVEVCIIIIINYVNHYDMQIYNYDENDTSEKD